MGISSAIRSFAGLEGKALTRADYEVPEPQVYNTSPGRRISSRTAARHLAAYGGDDAIDWVMDCIALRAESASTAGFQFDRNGKTYLANKTDADPKEVGQADRSLVELLRSPNPWFTYTDLIELLVIDYLLTGDAFWLKFRSNDKGQPIALYRLAPPLVSVIPGKQRLIDAYEYKVPGSEPVTFAPEDIVHFRRPNPHDPYLGLGLVKGGARVLDIELNLVESQAGFFERGTKLSGVLESDQQVPPKVREKIRRTWAALYGGPRNSGVVAVLERGLKFNSIQPNAVEAAFAPLSTQSRDRICALLGTPVPLIQMDAGLDPKALGAAERRYANKTVRPMLDKLEERISLSLTQAWSYDFKVPYEYKMPPEDAIDLATGAATLPGFRIREVRELAGYPPLGDERDDIVLNLPGKNDNRSTVKDRGLPHEPGRPPNPENTAAIPEDPADLPTDAAVSAPGAMGRRSRQAEKARG